MSGPGQPIITIRLHVCGITNDGRLWHASRPRDKSSPVASWGPWSAWEEVKAEGAGDVGPFVSVGCAVEFDSEKFHVCGVTQDGTLWHTSRLPPDDWQPFEDLKTRIKGNWDTFDVQKVATGRFFGDVCVIVFTASGAWQILHTAHILFNDSWEDFQNVTDPQLAGSPGSFIKVSCANVSPEFLNQELNVCGITEDGALWHTLRSSLDSSWQPFADVQALSRNTPGPFAEISIAEGQGNSDVQKDLHVFAQASGDLWHTVRFSNPPSWQAAFDRVKELAGNDPGSFGSISAADVDGDLHVCGVTHDGKLWHTIRVASNPPRWQPFQDVTAAGGGTPGSFSLVSLAVDLIPPGPSGADTTCEQIKRDIANDRLQIRMLQQKNPNDPRIGAKQQDIVRLQNRGRQHQPPCLP
jgi:hypothetical protein